MIDFVASIAAFEARRITRRGALRVYARDMTVDTVLGFDVTALHPLLLQYAPCATEELGWFRSPTEKPLTRV